mgnify:FL=1
MRQSGVDHLAAKLESLKKDLDRCKELYQQGKGRLQLLQSRVRSLEAQLSEINSSLELWDKAHALLVDASGLAREQVRRVVEDTVTAALQAVISEELTFRVEMGDRGGQPTADWLVVSKYGQETVATQPEDARGGGIVDVVSLALRLALLELIEPAITGPLILDEPGKMVSEEYIPRLAAFLRVYAEQTGRQVLMVTHNHTLAETADLGYRVTKENGISYIEELNE